VTPLLTQATGRAANHDRCALCGGVFFEASPQAEHTPALTDDQLLDVLHALSVGEYVAWFDDQYLCVDCTQDLKALRFDMIVERRRARQDGERARSEDE